MYHFLLVGISFKLPGCERVRSGEMNNVKNKSSINSCPRLTNEINWGRHSASFLNGPSTREKIDAKFLNLIILPYSLTEEFRYYFSKLDDLGYHGRQEGKSTSLRNFIRSTRRTSGGKGTPASYYISVIALPRPSTIPRLSPPLALPSPFPLPPFTQSAWYLPIPLRAPLLLAGSIFHNVRRRRLVGLEVDMVVVYVTSQPGSESDRAGETENSTRDPGTLTCVAPVSVCGVVSLRAIAHEAKFYYGATSSWNIAFSGHTIPYSIIFRRWYNFYVWRDALWLKRFNHAFAKAVKPR